MKTIQDTNGTSGATAQEKVSFAKASQNASKEAQNALLDQVIKVMHLKNDAALARLLEVAPPVISKLRHRRLPVGATLAIMIHEVSELSIGDITCILNGHA